MVLKALICCQDVVGVFKHQDWQNNDPHEARKKSSLTGLSSLVGSKALGSTQAGTRVHTKQDLY